MAFRSEEIRKKIKEARKKWSADEITSRSNEVTQRFLSLSGMAPANWKGLRIALYRALPAELDLSFLEKFLSHSGAALYFPRIKNRASKEMEFVQVPNQSELAWKIGPYGISEPHPELKEIEKEKLDLIFVPGVAFGMAGERIGAGAGYYDRFLANCSKAIRVALAFDFQVIPGLPQESWDQKIHWLVTQKQEFQAAEAKALLDQFRKE